MCYTWGHISALWAWAKIEHLSKGHLQYETSTCGWQRQCVLYRSLALQKTGIWPLPSSRRDVSTVVTISGSDNRRSPELRAPSAIKNPAEDRYYKSNYSMLYSAYQWRVTFSNSLQFKPSIATIRRQCGLGRFHEQVNTIMVQSTSYKRADRSQLAVLVPSYPTALHTRSCANDINWRQPPNWLDFRDGVILNLRSL